MRKFEVRPHEGESDSEAYFRCQQEMVEQLNKELPDTKKQLFDLMSKLGFVLVEVEFDGGGDEGCICGMHAFKKIDEYGEGDGPAFDLMPFTERRAGEAAVASGADHPDEIRLATAVEAFTYDCLPGGWEINEGSYGTLYVRPDQGQITLEFNRRYEEFIEFSW
jgi:hypothetical protein